MPVRQSGASKKPSPASAKSHKRGSSDVAPAATPGSRASKRLKESNENERTTGKFTPTKSKYFLETDSEDEDVDVPETDESGYEDQNASVADDLPSDEPGTEDDYDSEEDSKRKRKPKKASKNADGTVGGVSSAVNAILEKGKELWRPGVKAGLGPGKQVFIEKPKPRGDGGIKYAPEKIHPNTMTFLKDLKANNDREWLKGKRFGFESMNIPIPRRTSRLSSFIGNGLC